MTSLALGVANRHGTDEDVPLVQVHEKYLGEAGAMDNLEKKLHKMIVNAASGVSKVSDDMLEMLADIDANMDEILNDTQEEHEVHVEEMNAATKRVNKCVEDTRVAHSREGGINELAENQMKNGEDHVACRKSEKEANTTMTETCGLFTDFGNGLTPPSCSCTIGSYTAVTSDFDWLPDEPNPMNEECLRELAAWAAEKKKSFVEWEEKCKSSTDAWADQKRKCVAAQVKFEKSWCQHASLLQNTCHEQRSCFKDASDAHAVLCGQIRIAVHARKAKYFASKKVKCYIQMLREGHECTEAGRPNCYPNYESCTTREVDRSHLDIPCQPHDQPLACNQPNVLTPFIGTDAWEVKTYSSQVEWYPDATTNAVTTTCTDQDSVNSGM